MGHVIVTGGSSGIGAAFAKAFAASGDDVSIIARDPGRLAESTAALERQFGEAGRRFFATSGDVRDAGAVAKAIRACEQALGPCSTLVTSAGIVTPGRFVDQPSSQFEAQIATNLIGTANAVRCILPGMIERRSGRILIVGSGAGLIGIYGYSAYCASKSGLIGFAEALRAECKRQGIGVHICFPPDTDTPQLKAELPARPPEARAVMGSARAWTADDVATSVIAALRRGTFAIYPGSTIRMLGLFGSSIKPALRLYCDRKAARADRRVQPRDRK